MKKLRAPSGFSLLELAVAIAVAGLLIAGVMAGRQLMDSGKATSVVTDTEEVQRAVAQFVKTYGALPGDMANASTRLGVSPDGTATFNGNGNGEIDNNNERQALWQHLALAGLIKGQYNPTVAAAPGTSLKTSKFGRDVGMQVYIEPVSSQVMIEYSRFQGGAGDYGFLTAEEARRIDQKYDDGNPTTGRIRAADGTGGTCLNGTNFDLTRKGRDCYLRMAANALDQNNITVAATDNANINPTDTSTSVLKCAGGVAVGGRIQFDCPDNAAQKYFKICRKGGIFEVDPNGYGCQYPACNAIWFNDRKGNPVYFAGVAVGTTSSGICATATGSTSQATYRWGFDDGGNIIKQDTYTNPALKCLSPGADEGWHYADNLQHMSGYCDTICRYAQIPNANIDIDPKPMDSWLDSKGFTARDNQVVITCKAGFSDSGRAETTAEVSGESNAITCNPTAGAGYTSSSLDCKADCSPVTTMGGYNATRMVITDSAPMPVPPGPVGTGLGNVRHGSTVTVSCATGYSYGLGVDQTVTVSCNSGAKTIKVHNNTTNTDTFPASLPYCYKNCITVATSANNFYSPMTMPGGAAPGTALHNTTQAITCNNSNYFGSQSNPNPSTTAICNDGTWSIPLPACYRKCGGTRHGGTQSCNPGGCGCGVSSQGSQTCNDGSWGGCSGGSCNSCGGGGGGCECGGHCCGCGAIANCCCQVYGGGGTCSPSSSWCQSTDCCSDQRLKTDIRFAGMQHGIPLYHFRYINDPSHAMYEGVMAQDVSYIPGAVNPASAHCGGYMSVNYDVIGVKFKRLD
ncbi:prepilin-type N-terminal cleavage/methylation domain-containing protein [bacterium]|nr:prepilin-type N-terminal cleavage/methylation domain-containing protein [bacterium]